MKNSICIVTTIFNARRTIRYTIDSLINQTNSDFIHYIYDDGSSDPCDDIIEWYKCVIETKKLQIKLIYEKGDKNIGCDKAHEYAFCKDYGSYFMWLDSGDSVSNNFIDMMIKKINRNQSYDWYHFNTVYFDYKNRTMLSKKGIELYKRKFLFKKDQYVSYVFKQFYYHLFLVKRKSFNEVFPKGVFIYDQDKHGGAFYDDQIIERFILCGKKMCYVKPLVGFLYKDDNSVSTKYKGDLIKRESTMQQIATECVGMNGSYFFMNYRKKAADSMKTHLLCRNKDTIEIAKNNVKSFVMFLRNNDKRVMHSYPFYFRHHFILFVSKIPLLRKLL